MEGILATILKGLFVLVALIMTFFILLQEGKGGGLAGLGGTKAAGVEGVTNPIRRATAVLSIIFFLLAILLGIMARPTGESKRDKLFDADAPPVNKPELKTGMQPEAPMPVLKKVEEPDKPDASKTDEKADKKAPDADAAKKDGEETKKPAEKAGDKADEKPAEKATGKPAEKPGDEPAEKKADTKKDAEKPVEKKAE